MSSNNILPIILCGGSGTRLWPLSRESYPKQFININSESEKTLLQKTVERTLPIENVLAPLLICNQDHRFIVGEQMREINIKPNSIILEPLSKNTAASIALSALKAFNTENDPVLLVLASDHLIKNNDAFIKATKIASELARNGKLVTFGIVPTSAETGFGYIKSKEQLNMKTLKGCNIEKFIEKPSQEMAQKFFLNKKYSWNSGMFVFKASVIISELEKFAPELIQICRKSIDTMKYDLDFQKIDESVFSKCESVSIDVAVMEKTNIGSVVPLNCGWSDIGSWNALLDYEQKDECGNSVTGKVILKNVKNSLFRSEERLIVGIEVEDLIVVDTFDATLIMNKNSSQEVKQLVKALKDQGMEEAIQHKRGYRPWGNYLSIAKGKSWQLKLIEVNPGAALSLQKHKHRSEHWVVVKGQAHVKIEENEKILNENESTFIPLGHKHQLSNMKKFPLQIIEVQCGDYLGEDDIIRFEDKYGR